ncbi:cytochrome P450 2K1-like [Anguilla anguilla]|uniref:cytochrome P450 2K1-like n=1 Tax=Anguilla anguilla TaxID=7936 RepID=UPI0015B15C5D|nr:cytochrome P450 2K1-like [Anguilla anguilla]
MSVAGLLPQTPSAVVLLGAALVLFGLCLLTATLTQRREPPGPRPLPLIGNLLQLDLHRPYHSLYELSKKYGSVFTVHFGPKKAVVLAGYKTVKEALVNHATEFGNRDISPALRDLYKEHGMKRCLLV